MDESKLSHRGISENFRKTCKQFKGCLLKCNEKIVCSASKNLSVNCANKTNRYNRYGSSGMLSGLNDKKTLIDGEISHPINGSNTSNKSERKRNINTLNGNNEMIATEAGEGMNFDEIDMCDNKKRIKVDETDKSKMYQIYQPWVLRTYGDLSKSKTITLKKQSRIVNTLKGLESHRPDSSKFRFWVKSKGFLLELPVEQQQTKENQIVNDGCSLFIRCKSDTNNDSFKRVAIVEYFFDIIYKVHCSVEGAGRHVGQKRTYRKITEYYAFLPREAVTKFLTQCSECCKSMKSTIVKEISENEEKLTKDDISKKTPNSQPTEDDSKKDIENYYLLVKSLCEKSSLLNRIKDRTVDIQEQSCVSKCESSKNKFIANRRHNKEISNQQIQSRSININVKSELDNSLDRINVVERPHLYYDCNYRNNQSPMPSPDSQHIVTSSSSELIDDQESSNIESIISSKYDNELSTHKINENSARAVYGYHGVIPDDDVVDDYCNIKCDDYDESTGNNNLLQCCENNSNDEEYLKTSPFKSSKRLPKCNIKPITSTYLLMTRSMGLTDEDALNLDSISSYGENNIETMNAEDSYANLLKDADKLKLMLLAWNYQNSAAVRNGSSGPDMITMTNLWEQYQNALGINATNKTEPGSLSPSQSQEEANSPSDTKEEDEGSEDESDERMDQASYDPERLKAFNMFVRLFVDENLDRMIPISKQPKEKVQAIIDSCSRQFPEFSERARKRLRTYLKSCRRNKKTKDGWENQPSRPTPAHLTSVQAEQILAIACENESMNAKRMRIGLEPISQPLNIPSSHSSEAQSAPSSSLYTTAKSMESITTPLSISTSIANCKASPVISTTTDSNANSVKGLMSSTRTNVLPASSPYDFSSVFMPKTQTSTTYYNNNNNSTLSSSAQDLSVKRPLLPHNLNVTEAVAVKQLITGYREAAAFLLRSADELEQLLLNQQQ